MSRATYQAARRRARDSMETREERGLPAHPENWWIDCRDCEGSGEHLHNDSPISDPQCEYEVTCDTCGGDGVVIDGRIDLLVQLRRARLNRNGYQPGVRAFIYRRLRDMALSGSPLAQLRMIEAAIGCDLDCRAAVQAWRAVA